MSKSTLRVTHQVLDEQKVIRGDVVVLIEVRPKEGKALFTMKWQPNGIATTQWDWESFVSQTPNGPELAIAFRNGRWCITDIPRVVEINLEEVEDKISAI